MQKASSLDATSSNCGGEVLMKCGLCGAEVKEQPKITADGKCSVCGAKLAVKK
jgi:DNA-directed RNA polymerase subunit RPC12/RpoP